MDDSRYKISKKFQELSYYANSISMSLQSISNDLVKYPGYTNTHAKKSTINTKKDINLLMKQIAELEKTLCI